jgi:serpin B
MIVIAGCGLALLVAAATEPTSQASQPDAKTRALVAAHNAFGFNLFGQLQQPDEHLNVFISPVSIAAALGMTYNGAAGETAQAMAGTLKLAGMSLAEVNQGNAALLAGLKSADPKVELAIASSLWARHSVEFLPEFLARNRQFYGAAVATLDFRSPTAIPTINRWVNANTKGKIPQIIGEINAQTAMLLLNAVYFKGQWQVKFDRAKTKDEPFRLLSGRRKPVPMMSQASTYPYYRDERFQAISLPYGQGGTSLYLFLPDQEVSWNDFVKGLRHESWEEWLRQFSHAPGDLKLPRFKLAYERDLNAPLAALGMGVAFEAGSADFTGMRAARDLFIEQVKHKAVVEVDEEGTEAAATTSVGIAVTSVRPKPERFTFIADRPFWMAIRDGRTGAVLFMGSVVEPG